MKKSLASSSWRAPPDASALASRIRRKELKDQGDCINGAHHQKPTSGRRCEWCKAVHRYGIEVVIADPAMQTYKPPNYRYVERKLPLAYVPRATEAPCG